MSNVLVIIGHPSQKSFNYKLYEEVIWFCRRNRLNCKSIDLYREDFDPIVRENESEINKRMVLNYQDLINWSDTIVFISPVWWSRCTTMLEGFFDKILLQGVAFESGNSISLKPLLSHKKVLFLLSLGSNSRFRRIFHSILTYTRLKFSILNPCFGKKSRVIFLDVNSKKNNNEILEQIDKSLLLLRKIS